MGFRENVLKILSNPYWHKGVIYPPTLLKKIIMEQLNVNDERIITRWIGKYRIDREDPDHLSPDALSNGMFKTIPHKEWHKGALELFNIIERYYSEGSWKFKALKDLSDFEKPKVKETVVQNV